MPRDVSLSDSKCWNGGQKFILITSRSGGVREPQLFPGPVPGLCAVPPCAVRAGRGEQGAEGGRAGVGGFGEEPPGGGGHAAAGQWQGLDHG